jgi:hypothetical protein
VLVFCVSLSNKNLFADMTDALASQKLALVEWVLHVDREDVLLRLAALRDFYTRTEPTRAIPAEALPPLAAALLQGPTISAEEEAVLEANRVWMNPLPDPF